MHNGDNYYRDFDETLESGKKERERFNNLPIFFYIKSSHMFNSLTVLDRGEELVQEDLPRINFIVCTSRHWFRFFTLHSL